MSVIVDLIVTEQIRPPVGAPIIVQVQDTTLQDAPATVLGEARGTVVEAQGSRLASIEVVVKASGAQPTVWAHIDTDGDGRVSRGDYITVQSFPVPAGSNPRLQVVLKRI